MGRGHAKNDKDVGPAALNRLSILYVLPCFPTIRMFFLLILGNNWVPTKKTC